jgi:DNA-binding protein YbaB
MVTGLPSADSLIPSIATLRRKLAAEEAGFRNTTYPAQSTDKTVNATVNGMVEALSVSITSAYPPAPPPSTALQTLQSSLLDGCGKALAAANAGTKPKASADASGYTLTGIPNLGQADPASPGFATSDTDLTNLLLAQDPIIAAKQFQGIVGSVSAIVDGTLTLKSITLTFPLPPLHTELEGQVVLAINLALQKAKHLFEDGIIAQVNQGLDSSAVTFSTACLWAQGNLVIGDRVKIKNQNGTFAPSVNSGSAQTNVGADAQVGDIWSRAAVELRDRCKANGNVRTRSTLKLDANASVTGVVTQNGSLLQIPTLSLAVTFPGTNQGDKTVAPGGTLTLAPGAFANVTVNAGATLFLSTGTYFFNNLDVEPNAKISCSSGSGQIVVNVKTGLIFRGSIIEKTGGRPKFFLGVFGTSAVSLEGPFTGTFMALTAPLTLATLTSPAVHTGAFYARDITVNPDNTITYFAFAGPPTPVST